jgi:hypothetical protein
VEVGGRVYVKATATFSTDDQTITTTAFAREAESKKGMDDAQVTGACSSYARKYALNGLFCIDDTKDADATETHGKTEPFSKPSPTAVAKPAISQIDKIVNTLRAQTNLKDLDLMMGKAKEATPHGSNPEVVKAYTETKNNINNAK